MSAFQILINQCVTKIIAYVCDQNTIFFSMKVKGKRFLLLYIYKKDSKKNSFPNYQGTHPVLGKFLLKFT